jgi:ribosomal-protein-alanine N-acetyltransferase
VSVTLRPATFDDLDALAEIETLCFGRHDPRDALAAELTRSWARIVVAQDAASPVAFVNLWRVADEVEVLFVATHPAHRRRGLARRLLAHALGEAAADGASAALLEVRRSNQGARALYESLGFTAVGERLRYYDDGEDALLLRAALPGPRVDGAPTPDSPES